jgi:glutamine amidotransferase
MCRHHAWLGERVDLAALVTGPAHGLERQAWQPRHMRHGTINADGWGVGWYDLAVRPEPARYRTTVPIWADQRFAEMAPLLSSGCVLAAVRDATPGFPSEETGVAPFLAGRWLFSHNGVIEGFRSGVGTELRRMLSERRESALLGATDSEVLFALVLDHLDAGTGAADAVAAASATVFELAGGRLNVLLTDGSQIVASAAGDTLFVRDDRRGAPPGPSLPMDPPPRGVHVASEPSDDDPRWRAVADGTIVVVDADGIAEHPLDLPGAA